MSDAGFYRLGAAAAWTGGVLGIVCNALHAGPRRGSTTNFLADLAVVWLLLTGTVMWLNADRFGATP